LKTTSLLAALVMLLLTLALFRTFQNQASDMWFALGTHPELRALLENAGEDLKALARLNPAGEAGYRERFERVQAARRNIGVLMASRDRLISRYELLLSLGLGAVLLTAIYGHFNDRRRTESRLKRVRVALEAMARGQARIEVGDCGRDALGRIAVMIEETARLIAGQRRRLNYLANLGEWQEAARRVAHEIRTPLAAMQLLAARLPAASRDGMLEEIHRLERFAEEFASFAGIAAPDSSRSSLPGICAGSAISSKRLGRRRP